MVVTAAFLTLLAVSTSFPVANGATRISFEPTNVTVYMAHSEAIQYNVTEIDEDSQCILYSENAQVAFLDNYYVINNTNRNGTFTLKGNFLGHTIISCQDPLTKKRTSEDRLDVKCLRKPRVVDRIFTASTATLVAIIYVNFGCAVQWGELRRMAKKPIGPLLGFAGQFILMPLLSYGMGLVLFPNDPIMRLGMFFAGVSPGGGASNIWTAILEGNIDLSILMTTVSTLAAFGMMPLWLFTLGSTIFADANIEVPYLHITTYVIGLVVPLAIGYVIQRYLNKVGLFLKRILKGFSSLLITFIIVFAIVTNLYLFELFSWQIVVAGMVIPWMGYTVGYTVAKLLRQTTPDALAVAVEIGIQNTGISIFLLRFSLDSLYADLTTVIPVSVAIMTPFPLMFLFICKKIRQRCSQPNKAIEKHTENMDKQTGGKFDPVVHEVS